MSKPVLLKGVYGTVCAIVDHINESNYGQARDEAEMLRRHLDDVLASQRNEPVASGKYCRIQRGVGEEQSNG